MKSRLSSILNASKINQSSSFILPVNEHIGAFNKNTEKIRMLQLDLETSKDTLIKLRSEIAQKNQELKYLKFNNNDKYNEYLYVLKVIEVVLKLLDPELFNKPLQEKEKEKDEKVDNYNTINNDFKNKIEDNLKDIKDEQDENEKNATMNSNNLNKKNLKRAKTYKTEHLRKRLNISNNISNKDFTYINSLQNKITILKELIVKKDDEMKEMQKTKSTMSYSNLKDNLEQNFSEFEKIKKQNEIMRTKIEDVSNLLFLEREGNKSLKSKLHVFQSSFKEFQENSERKNIDLETRLFKAQERERDCRIFHIRKADIFENKYKFGSLSKLNNNSLDDKERLKIADKELDNIKKEIEDTNKDIENKKKEIEKSKENNDKLKKKVDELTENNNKSEQEISKLQKKLNKLNNAKINLKKENKDSKNGLNKAKIQFSNTREKTEKMKENLKKKEKQILDLKNELEKLKQNNNFKDGTFFTSIGAKGKRKNEDLQNLDVNIDEELAEIEKKYKMINIQENIEINKDKEKEENKEEDKNKNIKENEKEENNKEIRIENKPENKDENLIENKNESIEGKVKEESKEKKQEIDSHSSKDMKTLREKIVYTSEQSKNNDYKEVINDNKEEKKEEIKDKSKAENNDENKEEFKEEINDKINNNNSTEKKEEIKEEKKEEIKEEIDNFENPEDIINLNFE